MFTTVTVLKYHMLRALLVAKIWQSTPISCFEALEITDCGCDIEWKPIWVVEVLPEYATALLLNKSNDIEMNKGYKNDDPIEDKTDDDMTRCDTDGV